MNIIYIAFLQRDDDIYNYCESENMHGPNECSAFAHFLVSFSKTSKICAYFRHLKRKAQGEKWRRDRRGTRSSRKLISNREKLLENVRNEIN